MFKTYITRKELHPDLVAELEHLKKLHDYDYARKCILDDLEKEYDSMIRTDIWYEAAKEYLNKNINNNNFDSLINNFKSKHDLWDFAMLYAGDYTSLGSCIAPLDIEFDIRDGINNKISIKELHNAYPNVVLENKFKQFCIVYKANNEK